MTPRRVFAMLAAVVVAAFAVYSFAARSAVSWDLTAERSATLSDETLRVLDSLDRRIRITAFYPRDAVGRVEAATLLARYRRATRNVTFRILDPRLAPGEAERLNVVEVGSAAVEDLSDDDRRRASHGRATPSENGQVEIAQYTIEIDITSAIARLVRGEQGTVCFTRGHGEETLGAAEALLRANAYETKEIDLLTAKHVSRSCAAVVVAKPTDDLSKRARRLLDDYLEGSGKVMLLADPSSHADLTPVSKPWGIRFLRGTVLEGDDDSHLPGDVTAPIVKRYAAASPVVRGLGPVFMPRTMGVDVEEKDDPGLTVAPIAMTSDLGYLDRDDLSEFAPDVDREGPIALGAAADDSEVLRPGTKRAAIQRTRILAWGDVDWATDDFFGDGSNARLFLQSIDWLTQPEDLVTAVQSFPQVRELELTEARSRYIVFLTAGVVPGLFVIAGALVWVIRRSR